MLSRQSIAYDEMSFLAGESDMARRIRQFDWENHPFGPAERWPQSLRSALSICLHSAFPTAIYWGPELRLLYNDAWASIPGPRHPAALGQPAQRVWSDIWHVIKPQFEKLIATGEGISVVDQMLPMRRFGLLEETYWSYSFTAIRGEDGAIAGVFNSGSETTHKVLLQRQTTFLLQLAEAFRASPDAATARQTALAMLGAYTGASRVGLREVLSSGDELSVTAEWTAPGVEPAGTVLKLGELGPRLATQLGRGLPVRINDATCEPGLGQVHEALAASGVGAALAVPWIDRGAVQAMIFLHSAEPRAWTDFDVSTADEVLKRTLSWMERERTAERERIMMREIDHRARNALAVVQSVIRLTLAEDIETFREKIEDRISALARSHALFSSQRWDNVDLRRLIEQELAPYGQEDASRVLVDGPPLPLRTDEAQTFALLLHELTTNSAKHGSLAAPGGRLVVRWSIVDGSLLRIDWNEVFPSPRPPVRDRPRGFGSTLLSSVVEQQLRGSIERRFGETSFECVLNIPLRSITLVEAEQAGLLSPPAGEPGQAQRGILILEDDTLLAMDLGDMVEEMGHALFGTYATVSEALRALEAGTPDLAILDVNVAEESSLPVAELLVARGTRIVFATGYRAPHLPPHLADAPRLTKPVGMAELQRVIANSFATAAGPMVGGEGLEPPASSV